MIALICFVLAVLASPFKSKSLLEAENAALRHQLIVLRRKMPGRPCRPVQRIGVITSNPILGGLHHHYIRI
jgi:hypothetical protein